MSLLECSKLPVLLTQEIAYTVLMFFPNQMALLLHLGRSWLTTTDAAVPLGRRACKPKLIELWFYIHLTQNE